MREVEEGGKWLEDEGICTFLRYEEKVLSRPSQQQAQDQRPTTSVALPRNGGQGLNTTHANAASSGTTASDKDYPLLRAMIPNKVWRDEAGEWVQTVSGKELTREELEQMGALLKSQLVALQGRPQALCSVREQIFSEFFDEMVRQITIECPERGLLLLRLRDQLRMSLMTYADLHRDSVELSRSKAQEADDLLAKESAILEDLEESVKQLKMKECMLEARYSNTQRLAKVVQDASEKARKEMRVALTAQQTFLKNRLQQLKDAPPALT